jgi:hypothetical protein
LNATCESAEIASLVVADREPRIVQVLFRDLRHPEQRLGLARRRGGCAGLAEIDLDQLLPGFALAIQGIERLERGREGGIDGERVALALDGELFVAQLLAVDQAEPVQPVKAIARGRGLDRQALEAAHQRLPVPGELVVPRELVEDHRVVGRRGVRALEQRDGGLDVAQPVSLDAGGVIQHQRLRLAVFRASGVLAQELDQIDPALLAVEEALELADRPGHLAVDLECCLV